MQSMIENAVETLEEQHVQTAQENSAQIIGQVLDSAWPPTC